jgi:hypothetical protein
LRVLGCRVGIMDGADRLVYGGQHELHARSLPGPRRAIARDHRLLRRRHPGSRHGAGWPRAPARPHEHCQDTGSGQQVTNSHKPWHTGRISATGEPPCWPRPLPGARAQPMRPRLRRQRRWCAHHRSHRSPLTASRRRLAAPVLGSPVSRRGGHPARAGAEPRPPSPAAQRPVNGKTPRHQCVRALPAPGTLGNPRRPARGGWLYTAPSSALPRNELRRLQAS